MRGDGSAFFRYPTEFAAAMANSIFGGIATVLRYRFCDFFVDSRCVVRVNEDIEPTLRPVQEFGGAKARQSLASRTQICHLPMLAHRRTVDQSRQRCYESFGRADQSRAVCRGHVSRIGCGLARMCES